MNSTTGGQVGGWWVLAVPMRVKQERSPLEKAFGYMNVNGLLIMLVSGMISACGVFVCWAGLREFLWGRLRGRRTIHGPRRLSVIGSSLEMGGQTHSRHVILHKAIALALLALSLGETRVVIASQPETARELLQSAACADRPQQLLFGRAIGFAPFGDCWRGLSRIAVNGAFFDPKRIAAHGKACPVEALDMQSAISLDVGRLGSVRVRDNLQRASLNNMLGSRFSRRDETRSPEAIELNPMEMLLRGKDTTAFLTEWIVAAMVLHPEIQQKVQKEVYAALESGCSDESELARLPYLQAAIKDTLRLHPPGALASLAHLSTQDVCVASHRVPVSTEAMVNMYAITYDPTPWSQPESFVPERYLEQDVDMRGNELRLHW